MILSNHTQFSILSRRRAYCIIATTVISNRIVFYRALLPIVTITITTAVFRLEIRSIRRQLICEAPVQSVAEKSRQTSATKQLNEEEGGKLAASPDERELRIAIDANRHADSNRETRTGRENQIALSTRQNSICAQSWSVVD